MTPTTWKAIGFNGAPLVRCGEAAPILEDPTGLYFLAPWATVEVPMLTRQELLALQAQGRVTLLQKPGLPVARGQILLYLGDDLLPFARVAMKLPARRKVHAESIAGSVLACDPSKAKALRHKIAGGILKDCRSSWARANRRGSSRGLEKIEHLARLGLEAAGVGDPMTYYDLTCWLGLALFRLGRGNELPRIYEHGARRSGLGVTYQRFLRELLALGVVEPDELGGLATRVITPDEFLRSTQPLPSSSEAA